MLLGTRPHHAGHVGHQPDEVAGPKLHGHLAGFDLFQIQPFQGLDDLRFKNLKGVMETPKVDNMDEENMKVIRSLLSPLVPRPSS